MRYWLGIDCGGTFIKAALYDDSGRQHALARRNLAVISDKPGYAERDTGTMLDTCFAVIRELTAAVNPADIAGIGISAQGKGLFALDKSGRALGRGILSSDQRALSVVKRWQAAGIPEQLYPRTRQTLWTGHPVSILRALKENDPERYAQIGAVLMSHDFLRYGLTGETACEETNISESNLYNFASGTYDPALAELLGIAEITAALPPIIAPTAIAGTVTADAAARTGLLAGTPVAGGLFDVVSTAVCAGLEDETQLNIVLGTWSVATGMTDSIDERQTLPFVYGKGANAGELIVHEASPTSAANLEWMLKLTGETDYDAVNRAVDSLPKGESSVLFVPFLYGSNAGLGMQAGLYGLQSFHGKAHIYQAVYEGVIFCLMHHLNRMRQRFPQTNTLRVTGGPAKSAVWMQMLADISGLSVQTLDIEETGCVGAALTAMTAAGVYPHVRTARAAFTPAVTNYAPNPAVHETYQHKLQRYQDFVRSLQTFNHTLNGENHE